MASLFAYLMELLFALYAPVCFSSHVAVLFSLKAEIHQKKPRVPVLPVFALRLISWICEAMIKCVSEIYNYPNWT